MLTAEELRKIPRVDNVRLILDELEHKAVMQNSKGFNFVVHDVDLPREDIEKVKDKLEELGYTVERYNWSNPIVFSW